MYGINGRIKYDFDGKKTLLYKAKKDKILNYKTLDVKPKVLTTDFMNIQQKVVDNLFYFYLTKIIIYAQLMRFKNIKTLNSLQKLL